MRVVIAPDSFGGSLRAEEAAAAMAAGWQRAHPHHELVRLPMSDGGEGLLDALLAGPLGGAEVRIEDVADAVGLATDARWLLAGELAVVESAEACGLARLDPARRDPRRTTTWGVGQLLEAARAAGARRVLVGLGGTATVDGGAGALGGLGFAVTVEDGSGLKVGGEDLPRVRGAAPRWTADWTDIEVELLADVAEVLADAPSVYGPQKGADQRTVAHLEAGLAAWRQVCERDLGVAPELASHPGSGAAGGLGYGVAAGLGATFREGADLVAELVGLDEALADADVVLTGEGQLDETSGSGKVVGHVAARAAALDLPVLAVVGRATGTIGHIAALEEAAPAGPGEAPADDVAAATERLAGRWVRSLG